MIRVTSGARRLLSNMVGEARQAVQASAGQAVTFRLVADGAEWGIVLDTPREGDQIVVDAPGDGDQIVDGHGDPVLLVGADVGAALDGATIETEDTAQGQRLIIAA